MDHESGIPVTNEIIDSGILYRHCSFNTYIDKRKGFGFLNGWELELSFLQKPRSHISIKQALKYLYPLA